MLEVGVGKSKIFKSLFALYLQMEENKVKNREEQERSEEDGAVEQMEDQEEKEKAVYPLHYGVFSSHGPTHDSRFATLTKLETELVFSTYGDDVDISHAESIKNSGWNCQDATLTSGAADTEVTKEKVGKGSKRRRSSEGEINTPKKAKVEAKNGVMFLADVAANEEEAIKKTWRNLKL